MISSLSFEYLALFFLFRKNKIIARLQHSPADKDRAFLTSAAV
jgi:hypothetical protein